MADKLVIEGSREYEETILRSFGDSVPIATRRQWASAGRWQPVLEMHDRMVACGFSTSEAVRTCAEEWCTDERQIYRALAKR